MIQAWLLKQAWKLATGGAAILSVLLGLALTASYLENRQLVRQIELAEKRINDPKTGYAARLAQSHTNEAQLQFNLDRQNQVLRSQESEAKVRLGATQQALNEAQKRSKDQAVLVRQLLAIPPKGDTLEDRYRDIDNRLLESLK